MNEKGFGDDAGWMQSGDRMGWMRGRVKKENGCGGLTGWRKGMTGIEVEYSKG